MSTHFHRKYRKLLWFSVLLIIGCVTGCTITNDNNDKVYLPEHRRGELVVWRKPGVSAADWSTKKANLQASYGGVLTVQKKCENCATGDLELWSGSAITNFINTEVASPTTRPRGKPTGEDDTLYYSLNMIVRLPIEKDMPQYSRQPVPPFTSNLPEVTVAVFDTGVDGDITNSFTKDIVSCKPGGERGWNFVHENNVTDDIFPAKHGTVVSKLIVDQVKLNPSGNMVNILPVKIFDVDGSSDLFNVLCGFSYAKNAGAQIINASFGFYYYHDEPPAILLKYVEEELTNNNILLVAAAGNQIESEDYDAVGGLGITGSLLRNLDYHYFYPGGLSKYLPNVYCVTTARLAPTIDVSPRQNYSKNIVDIATIAHLPTNYEFYHPFNNVLSVAGSSFATPIFTGQLTSWYSTISGSLDNKASVITTLRTNGVVFNDVPALSDFVRNGQYVK